MDPTSSLIDLHANVVINAATFEAIQRGLSHGIYDRGYDLGVIIVTRVDRFLEYKFTVLTSLHQ